MLKNIEDVKEFILWCKKNQVQVFKNNEIQFELPIFALADTVDNFKEINLGDTKSFADQSMTEEEEEELLMWSSNG